MKNTKKELIDFLKTFTLSFIVVYLFTSFLYKPVVVKGESMKPTLENNEYGLSSIISLKTNGLKRFDIVIIKLEDSSEHIVKRVIGLPNEVISIKNNKLYINNELIEQDFLSDDILTEDIDEYVIKENEYFCLGDNRQHSRDSRYYGTFNIKQIICKDIFILFPFDKIGFKK